MKTLLLILCLSMTAIAADYRITDYGAIPNDGLSDVKAFKGALIAAEQACGGTVVVPSGEFLIDAPIYSDFNNCPFISLEIRGEIGSELRVSVGASQYAFVFTWMNSLQVKNVTFLGMQVPFSHPKFTDAGDVFYFATVYHVMIDACRFYGLAVDKSIIRMANGKLLITNSQFNGNTAYYSSDWENTGAYIFGANDGYGNAWQNIIIKNTKFTDYAHYKGQYISKTSDHLTGAYVFTKAQSAGGHATTTGRVFIEDCFFDEGAHTAISVNDASFVEIRGSGVNLCSSGGSTGVRLRNVKHALISQVVADWALNGRPFLTTENVGFLKLSGLELRAGNTFWHNLGSTNMNIEYCEECASKPYIP